MSYRMRRATRIARFLALLLAVAAMGGCPSSASTSSSVAGKTCFDRDWGFHLTEDATGFWVEYLTPGFDDGSWRRLDLPHDWSIELPRDPKYPSGPAGGHFAGGIGWYRKRFSVPESWRGKRVAVRFDGVFKNAEVWANGLDVGRHPYGYSSFTMDLTDYIEIGAENLLVVRVDASAPRHSRWYSGSGIYRHVWLLVSDLMHIAEGGIYVTTPEVSAESALVRLETTVVNESGAPKPVAVRWVVRGPEGERCGVREAESDISPGESRTFAEELALANPGLWSPDHPALYRVEVELRSGEDVLDADATTFGVRRIEFSAAEGFLLNGEPVIMRGGCVHHDCGPLGSMSIDRAEERKVEVLKASGFNAVRCAHNPPAPAFLEACDRLGMLVIDEAFDNWRVPGTPNDYHSSPARRSPASPMSTGTRRSACPMSSAILCGLRWTISASPGSGGPGSRRIPRRPPDGAGYRGIRGTRPTAATSTSAAGSARSRTTAICCGPRLTRSTSAFMRRSPRAGRSLGWVGAGRTCRPPGPGPVWKGASFRSMSTPPARRSSYC